MGTPKSLEASERLRLAAARRVVANSISTHTPYRCIVARYAGLVKGSVGTHTVHPYGEPCATRTGAGGVRASRKKSALTIVTAPIVQNAIV